jgi:hypothetical protein
MGFDERHQYHERLVGMLRQPDEQVPMNVP